MNWTEFPKWHLIIKKTASTKVKPFGDRKIRNLNVCIYRIEWDCQKKIMFHPTNWMQFSLNIDITDVSSLGLNITSSNHHIFHLCAMYKMYEFAVFALSILRRMESSTEFHRSSRIMTLYCKIVYQAYNSKPLCGADEFSP